MEYNSQILKWNQSTWRKLIFSQFHPDISRTKKNDKKIANVLCLQKISKGKTRIYCWTSKHLEKRFLVHIFLF